MKNTYLSILLLLTCLINLHVLAQTENDAPLLGLPGDDLDLYAVLDVFQQSKTIEDFEKSLNDEENGISNMDLNNDGKVDFIKVITEQDGDDFLFILQDDISEKETQDVAVIAVSKDAEGKVSMQIIGDEKLYGENYVIEPRTEPTESVTANPAYVGNDPVTVNVEASTEVIIVESTPVVRYVYSPSYVPYYPTYYYGFYPYWWRPVAVIGIGIYRHNHWYHHHHYHGGHYGHTSVNININNRNTYNNYNRDKRKTSNTVNNNIRNGNFRTSGQRGSRPSTSQSGRGSNIGSTSNRSASRPTASRPATSQNNRSKSTARTSANRSASPKSYNKSSASRSRSSARPSSASRSSARPSSASRPSGGNARTAGRRR